jgi:post-GPI attachment to proteins factor 3
VNADIIIMRRAALKLQLFAVASASVGDRDPAYRACVHACRASAQPPSSSLRLLGWTELDNCRYSCAMTRTNRRLESGLQPLQYHGKWAFVRLAGMQVCSHQLQHEQAMYERTSMRQEPASVLFSIVNGASHLAGLRSCGILHSASRHRRARDERTSRVRKK